MNKLIILILLFKSSLVLADMTPSSYHIIPIEQVFAQRIIRNKENQVYSGQIKSQTGLSKFEKELNIDLENVQTDFESSMYIFGITDFIKTRAFQLLKKNHQNYILDYSDTGIEYKLKNLEKGKKYSYLQLFKVKKIDGINHVQVKNLVNNGLSSLYE